MRKRLTGSAAGQAFLGWILAGVIRFTTGSIRWTTVMPEATRVLLATRRPGICVFWHSRIMLMTAIWKRPDTLAMLQSPHPDGRIIAGAIQRLGFHTIWGSSTVGRGGVSGLINVARTLKRGTNVGITPDGPRGPRMRLSPGVVAAARMTGAPILPISWNVRHRRQLGTWDRMVLGCPFSDGVLVWGEPIGIPRDLTGEQFERHRRRVEEALNQVTERADRHFGHEPTEPAGPDETVPKMASR